MDMLSTLGVDKKLVALDEIKSLLDENMRCDLHSAFHDNSDIVEVTSGLVTGSASFNISTLSMSDGETRAFLLRLSCISYDVSKPIVVNFTCDSGVYTVLSSDGMEMACQASSGSPASYLLVLDYPSYLTSLNGVLHIRVVIRRRS